MTAHFCSQCGKGQEVSTSACREHGSCCICAAPCAEPIAVGDIPGSRAADVVCSMECEDECVSDSHNDARVDGEQCRCGACGRVEMRRVRESYTYRGVSCHA